MKLALKKKKILRGEGVGVFSRAIIRGRGGLGGVFAGLYVWGGGEVKNGREMLVSLSLSVIMPTRLARRVADDKGGKKRGKVFFFRVISLSLLMEWRMRSGFVWTTKMNKYKTRKRKGKK